MKRIFIYLLALAMIMSSGCSKDTTQSTTSDPVSEVEDVSPSTPEYRSSGAIGPASDEAQGFNSPESAAIAYLEALKNADINRMLDTFAIDIYVNNYDLETSLIYNRYFTAESIVLYKNEYLEPLAKELIRNNFSLMIIDQYSALCSFETRSTTLTDYVAIADDSSAGELISQLNDALTSPNLDSLEVLGYIPQESFLSLVAAFENESNLDVTYSFEEAYDGLIRNLNVESSMIDGADSMVSCVVVFALGDNTYLLSLDVLEYANRWFISKLGGVIGWSLEYALGIDDDNLGLLPLFPSDVYTTYRTSDLRRIKESIISMAIEPEETTSSPSRTDDGVSSQLASSQSFNSPEEASAAYLNAMRDRDVTRMMSTFAIDKLVRNFNYESSLNYYGGYYLTNETRFPNSNEFVTTLNVESYRSFIAKVIIDQYSLLSYFESGEELPGDQYITDEAAARQLVATLGETLNAPKLDTINVLGFIPLERLSEFSSVTGGLELPDRYFGEEIKSLYEMRAGMCGVDSIVGCITAFEISGNIYLLFLDAYEYDGKWLIGQLSGSLQEFTSLPDKWSIVPLSVYAEDIGFDRDTFLELLAIHGTQP